MRTSEHRAFLRPPLRISARHKSPYTSERTARYTRNNRAATVKVQRESTTSSTKSTGPLSIALRSMASEPRTLRACWSRRSPDRGREGTRRAVGPRRERGRPARIRAARRGSRECGPAARAPKARSMRSSEPGGRRPADAREQGAPLVRAGSAGGPPASAPPGAAPRGCGPAARAPRARSMRLANPAVAGPPTRGNKARRWSAPGARAARPHPRRQARLPRMRAGGPRSQGSFHASREPGSRWDADAREQRHCAGRRRGRVAQNRHGRPQGSPLFFSIACEFPWKTLRGRNSCPSRFSVRPADARRHQRYGGSRRADAGGIVRPARRFRRAGVQGRGRRRATRSGQVEAG